MRYRPFLLGSVSSLVLGGAAFAPAPAIAQAVNWNGFYAGLNIGGGSNSTVFREALVDCCFYIGGPGSYWRNNDWNVTVGGLVGHNWQAGNVVFGVEGDVNWIDGRTRATISGGGVAVATMMDWYGTLRARVGITGSPWMVYVTGGIAVAGISNSAGYVSSGSAFKSNEVRTGPVVGAGFEYRLAPNTNVRLEGLFADFGTDGSTIFTSGNNYRSNFNNQLTVVRGAVTWAW